jgi:uncharacterized protein
MWSFHDDFRKSLKALDIILRDSDLNIKALNSELGRLFFVIIPIIFREEQIVFPVALRTITETGWNDMLLQSREIGWCYGVAPVYGKLKNMVTHPADMTDLGTGFLDQEQLRLMLNHLPVDITFVDENDEVRYFSGSKERIFPRSKAIILPCAMKPVTIKA